MIKTKNRPMTAGPDLIASGTLLGLALVLLPGCGSSVTTGEDVSVNEFEPAQLSLEDWQAAMSKTRVPKQGCFQASHPNTNWNEVPCVNAEPLPMGLGRSPQDPPASNLPTNSLRVQGVQPAVVGNGTNDFMAQVGNLGYVEGTFPSVQWGSTDERSKAFSLQINSNRFQCATCDGRGSSCKCFQQFVYQNPGPFDLGMVFMEYWLIGASSCPGGWNTYGSYCYRNSNVSAVPAGGNGFGTLLTNLSRMKLTAAAQSGANDQVVFYAPFGQAYAASASDNQFNLKSAWNQVEFNVFGQGDGGRLQFGSGTTMTVNVKVDSSAAPTCLQESRTLETNSLDLVPSSCCSSWNQSPAIEFIQSNAGAPRPFCLSSDITPLQFSLL